MKKYLLSIYLILVLLPLAAYPAIQQIAISLPLKTTVASSTIKEYVETNFYFTEEVHCRILNIGVNDIYLVEAGSEKYVLRLSRTDKNLTLTHSEFLFELEWLEFLHFHRIPVSYPIHRLDNKLFGEIEAPEGLRFATLFSYAEGTPDMDAKRAFLLGEALAQLHIASDLFVTSCERDHLDITRLIDIPLRTIKDALGELWQKEVQQLENLAEKLRSEIMALDKKKGTYGIIAGDIHGDNQHFTQDNQVTMFDFEFCAYGYRIYDIATFRWGRGISKDLWHAFLEGYQTIRT
nr:phosphotransferase [Parachlamydiaceae bacterium]